MLVDDVKTSTMFASQVPGGTTERLTNNRRLWPHLLMGLYGFSTAVAFDLGFRLYGAEVVSVLGLVLVRWGLIFRSYPMLRKILGAYSLWLLAIVLADLVNGTALIDSVRNMATPIIGSASLVFVLAIISRNPSSLVTLLVAMAIGKAILGEPSYGDAFAGDALNLASLERDTNFFKVRIEPFLTPTLLLLACWVGRRKLLPAAMIFMAASLGYLLVDARSSGLVFFMSALMLLGIHVSHKPGRKNMKVYAIASVVVGYGVFLAYVQYTLTYNPDGHNGRQLMLMDNPYDPLENLLRGRSEWLVMPAAIAERPILGWGSWAEDVEFRFAFLRAKMLEGGIGEIIRYDAQDIYIPAHSLIGSAWLWSGLLGLIAMVWFLRIIWTMSRCVPGLRSTFLPAVIYLVILLYWHYFFSPPMVVRLSYPITLAMLILLTRDVVGLRSPQAKAIRNKMHIMMGSR